MLRYSHNRNITTESIKIVWWLRGSMFYILLIQTIAKIISEKNLLHAPQNFTILLFCILKVHCIHTANFNLLINPGRYHIMCLITQGVGHPGVRVSKVLSSSVSSPAFEVFKRRRVHYWTVPGGLYPVMAYYHITAGRYCLLWQGHTIASHALKPVVVSCLVHLFPC